MKKIFLFLIISLFFVSCTIIFDDGSDDENSFQYVDTSNYVNGNKILFPIDTDALHIFNCFYEKLGFGEFPINATYTHTETAILNNKFYNDTLTINYNRVKIYKIIDEVSSSFIVEFLNDDNNVLKFNYEWQYKVYYYWNNNKLDGELKITL